MNKKGSWYNPFSWGRSDTSKLKEEADAAFYNVFGTGTKFKRRLISKHGKVNIKIKKRAAHGLVYNSKIGRSLGCIPLPGAQAIDVIVTSVVKAQTGRTIFSGPVHYTGKTHGGKTILPRWSRGRKDETPKERKVYESGVPTSFDKKRMHFHFIIVPMLDKKHKIPEYILFAAKEPGDEDSKLGSFIENSPKLSDLGDRIINTGKREFFDLLY